MPSNGAGCGGCAAVTRELSLTVGGGVTGGGLWPLGGVPAMHPITDSVAYAPVGGSLGCSEARHRPFLYDLLDLATGGSALFTSTVCTACPPCAVHTVNHVRGCSARVAPHGPAPRRTSVVPCPTRPSRPRRPPRR